MKVSEYVNGHASENIFHDYVNDYENVRDFLLSHYVLIYQSYNNYLYYHFHYYYYCYYGNDYVDYLFHVNDYHKLIFYYCH